MILDAYIEDGGDHWWVTVKKCGGVEISWCKDTREKVIAAAEDYAKEQGWKLVWKQK